MASAVLPQKRMRERAKAAKVLMTIVMTLAVCSAYMLPVATPSNAVAFGSGEVSIRQMVRAGIWLNAVSLVLIVLALYTLLPLVFGVSI